MLRDVAQAMAELGRFTFDQGGALLFEEIDKGEVGRAGQVTGMGPIKMVDEKASLDDISKGSMARMMYVTACRGATSSRTAFKAAELLLTTFIVATPRIPSETRTLSTTIPWKMTPQMDPSTTATTAAAKTTRILAATAATISAKSEPTTARETTFYACSTAARPLPVQGRLAAASCTSCDSSSNSCQRMCCAKTTATTTRTAPAATPQLLCIAAPPPPLGARLCWRIQTSTSRTC